MIDKQVGKWIGRLGLNTELRYIAFANLVLVVLLAVALARLTTGLLTPSASPLVIPSSSRMMGTTTTVARDTSLATVAERHLFGELEAAAKAATARVVDAPKTRLNLTLRGIIPAIEGGEPFALIAEGGGGEHPYRPGDSLAGGAMVEAIHADRVLLKRGGRLETLFLSDAATLPQPARTAASPNTPHVVTDSALASRLGRFRNRLLSNPASAWKSVNVQPVREGDTIRGYRVEPKRSGRLLSQAGLQSGDIVTAVNGIPLSDTAQVGQVIKQLSTAKRLAVQIERNGAPQTLQVDIGP